MGIFKQLKKNELSEDTLVANFYRENRDQIKVREDNITSAYISARGEKRIDLKLLRLEEALQWYNEFKEWCYQTQGGKLYFDKQWEHMHNSKNPDFSYGERIKSEIEKCKKKAASAK